MPPVVFRWHGGQQSLPREAVMLVILPKAPVEKIIREAGARRVSEGAAVELAELLEKIGTDISVRALKFARHAGRKTVTASDIKLARP